MTKQRRYAEDTRVPVSKSRAEVEHILSRYGADQFMLGYQADMAMIAFRMEARHVRFLLPLPAGGSANDEQETRRRWRALAMIIKAKLEAVASGVSVFDDEFMPNIVLPDGKTVSEHLRPQIESSYQTGNMPALLPAPTRARGE